MEGQPFLNPNIAWFLLGAFSILWVVLGFWWGRKSGDSSDEYMFAGRNIGLALTTATLMASWVTGNTTLSAPEMGYTLGIWGMIGYALAGLGLLFFAPLAIRIKRLLPSGHTSGDFIRLRYGRAAWYLFLVITFTYTLGFLITQGMGAGLLLEALSGIDYRVGMVTVITVSTIYTLFGGMRAVVGTDFIQSMIIMAILVVVAVLAYAKYGTADVYTNLTEVAPDRLNFLLPAGLLFAWNTGLFSMGEIFQGNIWWSRIFSSRENVIFRSFIFSGVAWMAVPIVTGSIALVALAQDFAVPQVNMVFPIVAAQLLGSGGAVLVFLIIFSSLASTLDSLLASTADLIAEDVYRQMINPRATDQQLQRAARSIVILLGVLTIALSWNYVTTMYGLLLLTGALVGSTIWPIAYGLYWKSANRKAAFTAMLAGSVIGLTAYFAIAPYCAALLSATISAIIMAVWTHLQPENFDWQTLAEEEIPLPEQVHVGAPM
jgi:SSS family transporter